MIKLILLYFINFLLSLFKIFPVKKNQFFFESYQGKQFSCNPKAIFEYCTKNYSNKIFVWSLNIEIDFSDYSNKNKIITVKPKSFRYYFYLLTSKYVFTNIELSTFIPKRKNSIWVNTWHGGGAFKKVEHLETNFYSKVTKKIQQKNTDFYISSSKIFTQVMSNSTGIGEDKFLKIGMPRNDIFFENQIEQNKIKQKVKDFYKIPNENLIVLYAPTFRGNVKNADFSMELNFELIKNKIENKFNKKVSVLVRSHHCVNSLNVNHSFILNGTIYPDMQDLLVASDILITDYSSCIWDFALTGKTCFLFVPDLEEYEKNRGLYTNIESWPFLYAKTNEQLCNLIEEFDEQKSKIKIETYLTQMRNYDFGNSCKTLCKEILNI